MKLSILLATVLVASVAVPAFATNYYVVKNAGAKACNVIDSSPTSKDNVLGYPTVYQSKDSADQAMKMDKACSNN